jgi:hypothetical protein
MPGYADDAVCGALSTGAKFGAGSLLNAWLACCVYMTATCMIRHADQWGAGAGLGSLVAVWLACRTGQAAPLRLAGRSGRAGAGALRLLAASGAAAQLARCDVAAAEDARALCGRPRAGPLVAVVHAGAPWLAPELLTPLRPHTPLLCYAGPLLLGQHACNPQPRALARVP